MKISLAITTYLRYELTVESFAQVIDDPRIDDIVILDDCSTDGSYEKLRDHFKGNEKVRVIRQAQNRGMSLNKRDAIALAKNEWVIIFDSDNIIGQEFLNALESQFKKDNYPHLNQWKIYCPCTASPKFNYRRYSGIIFDARHPIPYNEQMASCLINTCNYVVNRDAYLRVYKHNPEMKGTDTIWFNYLWLKYGNSFHVVPWMEYFHRVHDGSGFLQDADYNMKKASEVRKLIMQL